MTTQKFLSEINKTHSKREISEKCGIGYQTVVDWSKGAEMKFKTAIHICKVLKLDIHEIIKSIL